MSRKPNKKGNQRKLAPVEPKFWHAFIATPAYDGKVDVDFASSMLSTGFLAAVNRVVVSASMMGNGAFIDLARNIFVKQFLEEETDATHLMFVDSDLGFDPKDLVGLVRSDKPICAGVYPRRGSPIDFPVLWSTSDDGGIIVEDEDWLMCDRVPTGFLCIRRDVLTEMAADAVQLHLHDQDGPVPQLFYTKIDEEGRFIGEDYCFCDDYTKRYGKKIPVWMNMDFNHGGHKGNLMKWLEEKIEESEQAENTSSAA